MKKKLPNKKTIIIFTGGPGTGKSGTATRFLNFLDMNNIVKISVDTIKEKNWDNFGFNTLEQKERLDFWSLEEFYLTIQKSMWKDETILIEYPFYQRHKDKLNQLIIENDYSAITVFLYTDMKTVYERGVTRDRHDDRHPAHFLNCYHIESYSEKNAPIIKTKNQSFDDFVNSISHKVYNIELGLVIPIDVTDFSNIDYNDIYEKIVEYQKGGLKCQL